MKIIIFGLGAIGSNLLSNLSSQYPDVEFSGIDNDLVEERNIGIQKYFFNHITMPKSLAMGVVLNLSNKSTNYTPIVKYIDNEKDLSELPTINNNDLIIDCFDNTKSRQLLKDYYKAYNLLHIGFSPTYTAEIIWNANYNVPGELDPDNNDICTLTDATSFIQFIVGFAGIVISDFIERNEKKSFIITNRYKIKEI